MSFTRLEDMAPLEGETITELQVRWREKNRGLIGRPSFRISRTLQGGEYRSDVGAYISGPLAMKKRLDELKRDGYVVGPSNADLHDAMIADEKRQNTGGTVGGLEGEALARQCFEEARAEGFKLDDDE